MRIKSWIKGLLIVMGLTITVLSLYTWNRSLMLENREKLVDEIKKEKVMAANSYVYKTWDEEYIFNVTKNILDQEEKRQTIDRLKKQETTVVYFHLNKNSIEYFISAEIDEKEENGFCRLAVRNRFFIMDLLNKQDLLVNINHKEHRIDKSICNALYGYGKPVVD